jgi:alpha-galactosidase
MKAVTDYVHSFGLKVGIYSSPGPTTCGGYEGSYQHEIQDANSYAKWGFDYLKYDWCSYGEIEKNTDLKALQLPYTKIKDALNASGRDIVLSLCQYGMGDVHKWGRSVGGNLWRTTGDITDSWGSMSNIGFGHSSKSQNVVPGGWNDPDMLVVGWVGWGPKIRPTNLSKHEQVTHITLWSMLAAPLLLGCDLNRIDTFTKNLICNHDVLEVDQDALGKAATRTWQQGKIEAWQRPLEGGDYAVALFNRGSQPKEVEMGWKEFGIPARFSMSGRQVRDLWQRKDLGSLKRIKVTVPGHGALMYRVSN